MSTRHAPKAAASGIQPWHIVLLVVALVIGVWQIGKVAVTARAAGDAKVVKPAQPEALPANASASTVKQIRDKDADSDN